MRQITAIAVHCSATKLSEDYNVRKLHHDHVDVNGWLYIGYHFYIDAAGNIFCTRPLEVVGAGIKNHNMGYIHICYEGGIFDSADRQRIPADTRTPQQMLALEDLIRFLLFHFPSIGSIVGHRDISHDRDCPCFDAAREYRALLTEEHRSVLSFSSVAFTSIMEVYR